MHWCALQVVASNASVGTNPHFRLLRDTPQSPTIRFSIGCFCNKNRKSLALRFSKTCRDAYANLFKKQIQEKRKRLRFPKTLTVAIINITPLFFIIEGSVGSQLVVNFFFFTILQAERTDISLRICLLGNYKNRITRLRSCVEIFHEYTPSTSIIISNKSLIRNTQNLPILYRKYTDFILKRLDISSFLYNHYHRRNWFFVIF